MLNGYGLTDVKWLFREMDILDGQLIVRSQLVLMYDNFYSLFNPVPLSNIIQDSSLYIWNRNAKRY